MTKTTTTSVDTPPTKARSRLGFWRGLGLGLLGFVLGAGAYLGSGQPLAVPHWLRAQIEDKVNATLAARHLPDGQRVSLGPMRLRLVDGWAPQLVAYNLALREPDGTPLVELPEVRLELSPEALWEGALRPRLVQLRGAQISVGRDVDGRISLNVAGLSGAGPVARPVEIMDAVDQMFARGIFENLDLVEIEALGLTLSDARLQSAWHLGDGRLVIDNRTDRLRAELSVTQLDSPLGAQATLRLESNKADSSAEFDVRFRNIAARDLAAQGAVLTFFEVLDAPISGRISGALDANGLTERFGAALEIGEGQLDPRALRAPAAAKPAGAGGAVERGPLRFEKAAMALRYDAASKMMHVDQLNIQSRSLRVKASAVTRLLNRENEPFASGTRPEAAVSHVTISEFMVDPEGLFVAPVRFSSGHARWRMALDPFEIEIDEIVLNEGEDNLRLFGGMSVDASGGWLGQMEVALNRVTSDKLVRLWPVSAVPKTREWLAANVGQGLLYNVKAALDFAPGREANFALDYDFAGAEVRVIKSLPPITDGHGKARIRDKLFALDVAGGAITAPDTGEADPRINVAGSTFEVTDITQLPAQAKVRLVTSATLEATLSLLDQAPFHFISKAGRTPDLGEGHAELVADLSFPLIAKIKTQDVAYDVRGVVREFRSDNLVPGREVRVPELAVTVDRSGLVVAGLGHVGDVPIDARFEQKFGPEHIGRSAVAGTAMLSDAGLRSLGISLPKGWLSGETRAEVVVDLTRGEAGRLSLRSDLKGAGLTVAPLSWAKDAKTAGRLELEARLSARPEITRLTLDAADLTAAARMTTAQGGGIDTMIFDNLKVGRWLDVSARLTGRGVAKTPAIAVTGGRLDLTTRPSGAAGGDGAGASDLMDLRLDRLQVTKSLALTGFSGRLRAVAGGVEGKFTAGVNGRGAIGGSTIAHKGGTAVRITSQDAGTIVAAAGFFDKMRGGVLDMTIQPRGRAGEYSGVAKIADFRVKDAPVLAELLSAVSGVGLLEQLNGAGLKFAEGDAQFLILPDGVQVVQSAASGASMGISGAGFYRNADDQLDIQGTVSPFYLVNGIGQILTKPGEGVFGFNYRLAGPAKNPQISVNPLSILTPGMFRDIFRRPMPVLKGAG